MQRKRAPLAEIVDVYGLRIIVDSVDTCYRAIGVVHSVYKPMPGRFKDYIAIPRVNGYQSLHTTLFGPNGVPIEVQIRTATWTSVAESGIAAHWKYKEHAGEGSAQQERARNWLSHLVEMQESGNSEEFIESVKVDLFPDKVYVFTPRGEILRLPRGATVVDFAYAVHTDIGNRCVAAKIDRRLTPLRTVLRNGQTVQIITAKGARPNPSWVNFVVTAKARSGIRHYLKGLKSHEAVELGRRLLQQALAEFHVDLDGIEPATLTRGAERIRARIGRRAVREASGSANVSRRWSRGGCCRATSRRAATDRPRRSRSRAPKAAGHLRALLLSAARRSDPRLPQHRPRHRHPPRDLRQRHRLPQAPGKLAAGQLAAERRTLLLHRDPRRGRQPHGPAGRGVGRDLRHADQHQQRQLPARRVRNRHR